jgi:mitochondrial intermediate peptidase
MFKFNFSKGNRNFLFPKIGNCNNKFNFLKKNFCQHEKQGIFGLEQFRDSKSLTDSTKNILEKYKNIVNSYPSMKTNTKLIEIIDNISNDCCTLIDGATALYHLHKNEDLKSKSFETINSINNFFEELNSNKKFYNKSLELYFSEFMTSWDFMNLEFNKILERNIEELAFFNKERKVSIQHSENEENISEILENLSNEYLSPTDVKYDFEISETEIKNLKSQILKTILQVFVNNSENKIESTNENSDATIIDSNKVFKIKADFELLTTILKKSDNKDLSERAYQAISNEFGQKNVHKMVEILKYRLKYANNLGYKSFAEYQLQMQTLKMKPEKLINILKEMWVDIRPNLIDDLKNLTKDQNSDRIEKYMTYFEVDALRSSYIDKHLKTIDEKILTKRFITVGNLLNGLKLMTRSLFTKDLVAILDEDLLKEEMVHESVLLSHLKDTEGNTLAKIYFDLFTRDGKFRDVFSQFTIQGSKTLNLYNQKLKQIPKVILATNFEVTDLDLLNMQVSFTDAKSIFHEYGHVLHSVLSKTDFQSLSGNRIPLDFAEIPSHLMEYFMYDYNFCKMWMIDKKSNEVIDKSLHGLFCLQSGMFANFDLQETLQHAIFDLEIHSFTKEEEITVENILNIHKNLIKNFYISSIFNLDKKHFEKFDEIVNKYKGQVNFKFGVDKFYSALVNSEKSSNTKLDHSLEFNKEIENLIINSQKDDEFNQLKSHKELIFDKDFIFTAVPHFRNYPSNYYTYIIGKVFANLIWTDLFTQGANLGQVGSKLENEYLSRGYTESPLKLLNNLFEKK